MSLPFSTEARRQFDPVAQQFGLACVACTEWGLRYESDKVFLKVNFDNDRSYELAVEIGQRDDRSPGPPFSLAEVLRLRGVQDATFVGGLIVSDFARLRDILARLAELTIRHASDFLMGSELSFVQVAKLREKESAEFELASELRYVRSTTEAAWAVRDYKRVVKALESVEPHLSQAERRRLEYARKQLRP